MKKTIIVDNRDDLHPRYFEGAEIRMVDFYKRDLTQYEVIYLK